VVEPIAFLGQAVHRICGFVAGAEDAVAELEVLEVESLQQGIVCAHGNLESRVQVE